MAISRWILDVALQLVVKATLNRGRFMTYAQQWPALTGMVLICWFGNDIRIETNSSRRYASSLYLAFLCIATLISHTIRSINTPAAESPQLLLLDALSTTIVLLYALCVPANATSSNSQAIDRERTVSTLSRLSFSWFPFHKTHAKSDDSIRLDDLPSMHHDFRAKTLRRQHQLMASKSAPLWKQLLQTFSTTLCLQWLLVVMKASVEFGSRLTLHHLLQHLELASQQSTPATWTWAVIFCISQLMETTVGRALSWVTQMKLEMPVINLLNVLIYQKLLNKKHTVQHGESAKRSAQTYQTTIPDMISNDSSTVSQVCGTAYQFPLAALKLLFDGVYLTRLVGIEPIVTAAAASVVIIPISVRLTKQHGLLRSNLSKKHAELMGSVSEALDSLHKIRLSSMEDLWQAKLFSLRAAEVSYIFWCGAALAASTFAASLSSVLLTSVTLSVYSYRTGSLAPSLAFAVLALFSDFDAIFRSLPGLANELYASWMSCRRIEEYLQQADHVAKYKTGHCIELQNATLSWDERNAEGFRLVSVNLTFPIGKLCIIQGNIGSGKTLLLNSIIGNADIKSGTLFRPEAASLFTRDDVQDTSVAVVSQPPWIENTAIKENILFGNVYDETRYQRVIRACALEHDLAGLALGDATPSGLSGAALSGGQKWRVALARALYSPASILVFEDILSAVDVSVANWLCQHALTGDLVRGRTVILATQHAHLCLPAASYLVTIEDGRVVGEMRETVPLQLTPSASVPDMSLPTTTINAIPSKKQSSNKKTTPASTPGHGLQHVATKYLGAAGGFGTVLSIIVILLISQAASAGSTWWLSRWTLGGTHYSLNYSILIYMTLSVAGSVMFSIKSVAFCAIGLAASSKLFQDSVHNILKAPMSWISTTPTGNLLQSFGKDLYELDHRLGMQLGNVGCYIFHMSLIIYTSFKSAPKPLICTSFIFLFYIRVASVHFRVSRKLKKLIPLSSRPILQHVNSTVSGLPVIRAFGRGRHYLDRFYQLLDSGTRVGWHLSLSIQWMQFRIGIIGNLFVAVTTMSLIWQHANASIAGFTITLALQLKTSLAGMVSRINSVYMGATAVDHLLDLVEMPTEPTDGTEPSVHWPSKGKIELCDVSVSYGEENALSNISCSILPGSWFGVVGRTGAGKTSLTNSILRIVEAKSGRILIDGVDVSSLPLRRLRASITVIPQDPFMWSGTLRSNLDPSGHAQETQVQEAVRQVRLFEQGDGDSSTEVDLDLHIDQGGTNLSHGQRQLLCLARAILTGTTRILILDEATSAMDRQSDALVEQVIRERFSDATVIVVTHRLPSVAKCNDIMVLDSGRIVEMGSPKGLLKAKSVFYSMVMQSDDAEEILSAVDAP
ncbi:hypothetical protein VHEMI01736 [[Torrubiella] hemipterigena]|uniref:P-loop containing nucleoside triphosphate hydrolase protein n=1 Tax=[Torrubiella] hemipterigena TaxID=1531966 RepID=A0A0A1STW6_9HYPO|nr:hypothetical protein VHEMI01736 [[Torrubiella] hemipterigena]